MKTIDMLDNDHMLRAFAHKGASIAIDRLRGETGDTPRVALEMAHEAAMEAVKSMAEGDGALALMRLERDHYKALALEMATMTPWAITVPASDQTKP